MTAEEYRGRRVEGKEKRRLEKVRKEFRCVDKIKRWRCEDEKGVGEEKRRGKGKASGKSPEREDETRCRLAMTAKSRDGVRKRERVVRLWYCMVNQIRV